MFDVAPSELLLVAIVALIFIGPKDLPFALRTLGRWVGQARRMSNHFKAGVDAMIREAEMAEIEREWRERNERIMAEHPDAEAHDEQSAQTIEEPQMEPIDRASDPDAAAKAASARAQPDSSRNPAVEKPESTGDEPQLPLSESGEVKR
ncbi:MAG: Sec-independent protein translocase protein TatB [Sphingomonadaceae bacterium]